MLWQTSVVVPQELASAQLVACVALEDPEPAYDAPIQPQRATLSSRTRLLGPCLWVLCPCASRNGNQFLFGRNFFPFNTLREVCQTVCSRSPAKWESSSEILAAEGTSSSRVRTRPACLMLALATSTNLP